jgi:alpha-1,2-mannosyltransferase
MLISMIFFLNQLKLSFAFAALTISLLFMNCRVQRLDKISKDLAFAFNGNKRSFAFYHPFTTDCGGGERVLWLTIKTVLLKWPKCKICIYTGERCRTKQERRRILKKAKDRFGVDLVHLLLTQSSTTGTTGTTGTMTSKSSSSSSSQQQQQRQEEEEEKEEEEEIDRRIEFIHLRTRKLTESKLYPIATIVGQMVGNIICAIEAVSKFAPDVFVDTVGNAWSYPFVRFLCGESTKIVAYVHYPTISSDMLERVRKGSLMYNNRTFFAKNFILKQMKIIYYSCLMWFYGYCGGAFVDVCVVNSKWTKNHIDSLWGKFLTTKYRKKIKMRERPIVQIVYPPCDVSQEATIENKASEEKNLIKFKKNAKKPVLVTNDGDEENEEEEQNQDQNQKQHKTTPFAKKAKRIVLGEYKVPHFTAIAVGQFRPEKNHALLLEAWKLMKTNVKNKHPACEKAVLKLVGGLRNKSDLNRFNALKLLAKEMKIEDSVEFYHDVDNATLKELLKQSVVGLHAMTDEHFGICIVEYMALGAIPIAHNSGGPKLDIVKHGRDGFLASDASSYAACLEGVFSMNDEKLSAMIEEGKTKSMNFSEEKFGIGLINALIKTL